MSISSPTYHWRMILLLLLLCSSCLTHASTENSQLQQLANTPSMQGHFNQHRQLKGISFTLQSAGQVTYLQDIGIYNETQTPIFQAISFSKSGINEWDEQGQAIAIQQNKADQFVSKLLLALFNGDQNELLGLFTMEENPEAEWQVQLQPRNALIAEHITSIKLKLGKNLESIAIHAANGDKTEINFHNFQPLSTEEAKTFCHKFPADRAPLCAQ